MNNTILIAIGLLIIASISVGIASITSVPTIVVYIICLVIWLVGIQFYYKVKYRISK
jgi:hypothetical protein